MRHHVHQAKKEKRTRSKRRRLQAPRAVVGSHDLTYSLYAFTDVVPSTTHGWEAWRVSVSPPAQLACTHNKKQKQKRRNVVENLRSHGKTAPPPPSVRTREWTKLCMGKSLLGPAERKRARVFASHARCTYEEHCRQAIIQHPLLTAVAAAFAETNQPRQNKTHTILDSSSVCTHLLATEARRVHRCQSLVQREPAIPVGLPGLEELRRRH